MLTQSTFGNEQKELQAEQKRHQDEFGAMSHSYKQEIVVLRLKVEAEHIEKEGLERELNEAKQTLYQQNNKVNVSSWLYYIMVSFDV